MNYMVYGTDLEKISGTPGASRGFAPTTLKFTARAVANNNSETVWLKEDGTLVNNSGKILDLPEGETIVQLSGRGTQHFLALGASGAVYSWSTNGYNSYGELGLGDWETASVPTKIEYFEENGIEIVRVEAGEYHSFAIDSNRRLYSWGINNEGDCVVGDTVDKNKPVFSTDRVVDIFQGYGGQVFILKEEEDGSTQLYAGGSNGSKQTGLTSEPPSVVRWVKVDGWTGDRIANIQCGFYFSCILTTDGEIYVTGTVESDTISGFTKHELIADGERKRARKMCAGKDFIGIIDEDGAYWNFGTVGDGWEKEPLTRKFFIPKGAYVIDLLGGYGHEVYARVADLIVADFRSLFKDDARFLSDFTINGVSGISTFVLVRLGQITLEEFIDGEFNGMNQSDTMDLFKHLVLDEPLTANLEKVFKKENYKLVEYYTALKILHYDDDTKDFEFIIDGDVIPIHRFILYARSKKFREMMKRNHELRQYDIDSDPEISVSYEELDFFVEFLTTDQLVLSADLEFTKELYDNLMKLGEYFEISKESSFKYKLNELRNEQGI